MNSIEEISNTVRQTLEIRTRVRDVALAQTRLLTRHCANAIRAIHREEEPLALEHLHQAQDLVQTLRKDIAAYPDLYYAGYTQDALKEFCEANLVFAFVQDRPLPTPHELGVEAATYMQGMAEAIGELRRRCLDLLRLGEAESAARLLTLMDDIYTELVTMDYPDAVTGGLRRLTDVARSLLERTRGDLTISLRQEQLQTRLDHLTERLARLD